MLSLPKQTVLRLLVGDLPREMVNVLRSASEDTPGPVPDDPKIPLVAHSLKRSGWLLLVPDQDDARTMILPEAVELAIRIGHREDADWVHLDTTEEDPLHRELIGLE